MNLKSAIQLKARHLIGILCFVGIAATNVGCQQKTFVSSSMMPTITPGEKIVVDYTAYALATPKRWEVVAFEPTVTSNQLWVMRVIGLPGETVSLVSNAITINGKPLLPPSSLSNVTYISFPAWAQGSIQFPYAVPTNCFFMLGDNSTIANDSRVWGALPRTNIVGRVRGK